MPSKENSKTAPKQKKVAVEIKEDVKQPEIVEDVKPVEIKEDVENKIDKPIVTKKKANKHDPSESFACRSVVAGELVLIGAKTKLQYTWSDYGDIAYVEYQDLQSLQSMKSAFLTNPWFVIEDEDLVDEWSNMLKPIYDKMFFENIESMFNLPIGAFTEKLKNIPEILKDTLKTKAAQMIDSGSLYDIRKIKAIDEACGTTLIDILD